MPQVQLKGEEGKPVYVDTGRFIGNEFVSATGASLMKIENPSNGPSNSAAQKEGVNSAVILAQKTFKRSWKSTSPTQRGQLLYKLADLIERDADDLALIKALDAGVLLGESKGLHIIQPLETL
ncbi:hypothetical protein BGZ61DRAFT_537933 [Ilyonectria robusta]|uniref:uncharacterized protein n=1 Tax=Ilyonectria robusta TaxID=1079257 RepID=UPI001E8CF6E7|nr:uncharacterized protein BGZ61DRAFT_537933 [Ilyonectria robusta]KAH8667753.1 hypothetical protein BGZ61DRAFT_537933 [Ilyonectria robusta]